MNFSSSMLVITLYRENFVANITKSQTVSIASLVKILKEKTFIGNNIILFLGFSATFKSPLDADSRVGEKQ